MQFIQIGENDILKRRVYLHLVDATDGITAETGEAGGRAKVSINGGTPANSINTLTAVDSTDQPGTYYLEMSPVEIKDPGFVIVRYKSANTGEFVVIVQIIAFDPYTRRYGDNWNGGGADVDYKRIRTIVAEEVAKQVIPEAKEPDLLPISEGLQALLTEIRSIDIPTPEKTNLEPILKQLEALQSAIKAIKIPEETDLLPVLEGIEKLEAALEPHFEDTKAEAKGMVTRVREFLDGDIETIKTAMSELSQKLDDVQMVVMTPKKGEPKEENILKEYLNI